jgi:hypothetical protein
MQTNFLQPTSLSKTKGTNGKLTRNKIRPEIRHQQDTYCKSFYNQKYLKTKKGHIRGHSFVSQEKEEIIASARLFGDVGPQSHYRVKLLAELP